MYNVKLNSKQMDGQMIIYFSRFCIVVIHFYTESSCNYCVLKFTFNLKGNSKDILYRRSSWLVCQRRETVWREIVCRQGTKQNQNRSKKNYL